MKTYTLQALVRIRAFMYQHGVCCNSFVIPNEMLDYFTSQIYRASNDLSDAPMQVENNDTVIRFLTDSESDDSE